MSCSVIITVSGKVQGVFFRAAAKKQADKLHLTGYAKNLSDGRVEINATGEKQAVEQLIKWSYKGSLFSKVQNVEIEDIHANITLMSFEIC